MRRRWIVAIVACSACGLLAWVWLHPRHAPLPAAPIPAPAPAIAAPTPSQAKATLPPPAPATVPAILVANEPQIGFWFRGIVRTPEGAPVERFTISLFPQYAPAVSAVQRSPFDDPRGEFELTAETEGPFDLVATAAGFSTGVLPQVRLVGRQSDAVPQEIILIPGGSIRGMVRTERGEPIAGALVQIEQYIVDAGVPELPAEVRNGPVEFQLEFRRSLEEALKRSNPNPWTETDAAGRFALAELPQGTYPLSASHPDYAAASTPVVLRPGTQLDDLVLVLPDKRPGSITVEVVDAADAPLAGAAVRLQSMGGPGDQIDVTRQTEAQGRVRLDELAAGRYRLTATADTAAGTTTRVADVPLSIGQDARVRFIFQPGATVYGRVDRSGEPVAGAVFALSQARLFGTGEPAAAADTPITGHALLTVTTDPHGQFEAPGLPPGSYQLALIGEEMMTVPFVLSPSDTRRTLAIHLADLTLVGTVRDATTRAPISGAMVRPLALEMFDDTSQVDHYTAAATCNAMTDAQGRYICSGVARGSYLIDVQAPGHARLQQAVDVALPETVFDATLQPAAQLIVTVTDTNRLPLPAIQVIVDQRDAPDGTLAGLTDELGLLHWPDLEPGVYQIRLETDAERQGQPAGPPDARVTLGPGETARITLIKRAAN